MTYLAASFLQMAEHLESQFLTTPWTLILGTENRTIPGADQPSQTQVRLCENYRYPVYAFIRKRCGDAEKARDLSQEFFAMVIEKKIYRKADPDRGRFRTFLLASVKNFLHDDYNAAQRLKRGGGKVHVSIDVMEAEQHYQLASFGENTAERLFDREWAVAVFDRTWGRVREEFEQAGQLDRFEALRSNLMEEEESIPYAEIANRLGLEVAGVKSAAFRLRGRFREIFREVVAQLVENPNAVDDEISYLIELMGDLSS